MYNDQLINRVRPIHYSLSKQCSYGYRTILLLQLQDKPMKLRKNELHRMIERIIKDVSYQQSCEHKAYRRSILVYYVSIWPACAVLWTGYRTCRRHVHCTSGQHKLITKEFQGRYIILIKSFGQATNVVKFRSFGSFSICSIYVRSIPLFLCSLVIGWQVTTHQIHLLFNTLSNCEPTWENCFIMPSHSAD